MPKRVIIVGAGIIGAAFAYELARAGVHVHVLDELPQAGGVATPNSWAWINGSWGNSENYFRLRHHSMALWRKFDKDVPGLQVNWCGGLLWDLPEAELTAFVKQQSAWGYGVRLIDAKEAQSVEPNVRELPSLVAHVAEEGAVEPLHGVASLMAAAKSHGAEFLPGARVKRLVEQDGRVSGVMTQDGLIEADDVVLAAGAAVPHLLETLDRSIAMDAPAGLLVHSEPGPELLRGMVMAPELHVRQTAEGRLVAGSDFAGMEPGEDPAATADMLFAKVKAAIAGAENLRLDFHTVGYRPTPRDGVSAIGRLPGLAGLYVCVTHSGITLAPALAALGAREIVSGERDPLLAGFSPERLLS